MNQRQIVLDTETTGLDVNQGHRVIEIGCVELINRRPSGRNFSRFLNPQRRIDREAIEVHGISNEFLADKPLFADIARELLDFLHGAELVIHNASFDVGFLDAELARAGLDTRLAAICSITDTVSMARRLNPGQKANLDALCRRYGVDNSNRELHGALLDARLLADVYLAMTGGQSALVLGSNDAAPGQARALWTERLGACGKPIPVIAASDAELHHHRLRLQAVAKKSAGKLIWDTDLEPR